MTAQFHNNHQQQVQITQEDVEANAQREFNRMTSTEERTERARVRRIFETVS